jgi:hypothetical protein
MQFRQENLHLREAMGALAKFTSSSGRPLSAVTEIVGSEGHVGGDSGGMRAIGQTMTPDCVNAGPSAWSVVSDVVFCSQDGMCISSRKQKVELPSTGDCVKPVVGGSYCGDNSYGGIHRENLSEPMAGSMRVTPDSSSIKLSSEGLSLPSPTMESGLDPTQKGGTLSGRLTEDNASYGPFNTERASSTTDIKGSVKELLSESECSTQQVCVPVHWLLGQTGGVHDSGESQWNKEGQADLSSNLSAWQNFLRQLLENERSVHVV